MTRRPIRFLVLVLCAAVAFIAASGVLFAQENADCFGCHSDRSLEGSRKGRKMSVFVDEKKFAGSIHGSLSCINCHADLEGKELPHDEDLKPVNCGNCHDKETALHAKSLHGQAIARGDELAPHCSDCHGKHDIVAVKGKDSPVAPLKVPFLCGKCHQEGGPVQKARVIHQDHILENFSESIHGEGLLKKGLIVAPNCASCHTAHSILPHTDPSSSIARIRRRKCPIHSPSPKSSSPVLRRAASSSECSSSLQSMNDSMSGWSTRSTAMFAPRRRPPRPDTSFSVHGGYFRDTSLEKCGNCPSWKSQTAG